MEEKSFSISLGAIAKLLVKNYQVLADPVMHRIPNKMMTEIAKYELHGKEMLERWRLMHKEAK